MFKMPQKFTMLQKIEIAISVVLVAALWIYTGAASFVYLVNLAATIAALFAR